MDLIKINIQTIERISSHIKLINRALMWLQPFQMWAYEDYTCATNLYVQSLQAEVLARDPGLYVGEQVDILFYYKQISKKHDLFVLSNGKLLVRVKTMPKQTSLRVSGIIRRDRSRYIIE